MLYKYNFQVPWQALDIGQEKVYVVGTPSLKEKGSRTFKGFSHWGSAKFFARTGDNPAKGDRVM